MIRGGVSGRLVGRKIESPQNHKGKEKGNQCYTEGYSSISSYSHLVK